MGGVHNCKFKISLTLENHNSLILLPLGCNGFCNVFLKNNLYFGVGLNPQHWT
jgi:hypothetical protein